MSRNTTRFSPSFLPKKKKKIQTSIIGFSIMRAQNKQRNTSIRYNGVKNSGFIRSISSLLTIHHAINYGKSYDILYSTSIFQVLNHDTYSLLYFLLSTLNLCSKNKILIIIMKLYFFFFTLNWNRVFSKRNRVF